jgi:hypothetical protein
MRKQLSSGGSNLWRSIKSALERQFLGIGSRLFLSAFAFLFAPAWARGSLKNTVPLQSYRHIIFFTHSAYRNILHSIAINERLMFGTLVFWMRLLLLLLLLGRLDFIIIKESFSGMRNAENPCAYLAKSHFLDSWFSNVCYYSRSFVREMQ